MKLMFAFVLLAITLLCHGETGGRLAFARNEKNPQLRLHFETTEDLKDLQVFSEIAGIEKSQAVGSLPTISVPLETNLRPGDYPVKVTIKAAGREIASAEVTVTIVGDKSPAYPVLLNGACDPAKAGESGFTHALVTPEQAMMLDQFARNGLRGILLFDDTLALADKFPRLNRNHRPYSPPATETSNPEVRKLSLQSLDAGLKAIGYHPALAGILLNPAPLRNTNPSFGEFEPAAFKKLSGHDIPRAVTSRSCPNYQLLKDFPGSRIIPADYPLWVYYHWFWTAGDGWNPLNNALADAFLKSHGGSAMAIAEIPLNSPPFTATKEHVNYLSRKITAFPDPLMAAYDTDKLLAFAGGKNAKAVLPDFSVYWARSKAAPGPLTSPVKPLWLEKHPETEAITLSPDFLRAAFWSIISRRADGMAVNGRENDSSGYVNRDSAAVLKDLLKKVVEPLGPMLKQLPERAPEVLVLHSAAPAIFTDDQRNWLADLYLALQWGNFQTAVIHDDHIRQGALNQAKILVLPACEVLNQDIFEAVKKFQGQAGIVIADEYLTPGIVPDLMIRSRKRQGNPPADKAAFQKLGADLRLALEPHFKPYITTENQDIVVRVRSHKQADYLFIINDKRTFGEYVGTWGKVMELGQPNTGSVYVARNMNYGYDLVSGEELIIANLKDKSGLGCALEPGGGRLIMLLPDKINEVVVDTMEVSGNTVKATVRILNEAKKPVEAILPVAVSLNGADDVRLDGSGYYCAVDGVLELELKLPVREPAGELKLLVKDIASGKTAMASISHGGL